MASVAYDSSDAIFGSGVYGVARYGQYGPTLTIDGVEGIISLGDVTFNAVANTTLVGVSGSSALGVVTANIIELIGQDGGPDALVSSVGTVSYEALANKRVSVTGLVSSFGAVTPDAQGNANTTGLEATSSSGTFSSITGGATAFPASVEASAELGSLVIEATTGLTGVSASLLQGEVTATGGALQILLGYSTVISVGEASSYGGGTAQPSTTFATGYIGDTSESGVIFDFEPSKRTYSRKRTIILPRAA